METKMSVTAHSGVIHFERKAEYIGACPWSKLVPHIRKKLGYCEDLIKYLFKFIRVELEMPVPWEGKWRTHIDGQSLMVYPKWQLNMMSNLKTYAFGFRKNLPKRFSCDFKTCLGLPRIMRIYKGECKDFQQGNNIIFGDTHDLNMNKRGEYTATKDGIKFALRNYYKGYPGLTDELITVSADFNDDTPYIEVTVDQSLIHSNNPSWVKHSTLGFLTFELIQKETRPKICDKTCYTDEASYFTIARRISCLHRDHQSFYCEEHSEILRNPSAYPDVNLTWLSKEEKVEDGTAYIIGLCRKKTLEQARTSLTHRKQIQIDGVTRTHTVQKFMEGTILCPSWWIRYDMRCKKNAQAKFYPLESSYKNDILITKDALYDSPSNTWTGSNNFSSS